MMIIVIRLAERERESKRRGDQWGEKREKKMREK